MSNNPVPAPKSQAAPVTGNASGAQTIALLTRIADSNDKILAALTRLGQLVAQDGEKIQGGLAWINKALVEMKQVPAPQPAQPAQGNSHKSGQYQDFMAATFKVAWDDKNEKKSYKMVGHPWALGVTVYPEVLPSIMRELGLSGELEVGFKKDVNRLVRVEMGPSVKDPSRETPKRVIGFTPQ